MSKREKFLRKFLQTPIKKELTFSELETLLFALGYVKLDGAGSAIKFYNEKSDNLINLHKPHPSDVLKVYMIKQIQMKLKDL